MTLIVLGCIGAFLCLPSILVVWSSRCAKLWIIVGVRMVLLSCILSGGRASSSLCSPPLMLIVENFVLSGRSWLIVTGKLIDVVSRRLTFIMAIRNILVRSCFLLLLVVIWGVLRYLQLLPRSVVPRIRTNLTRVILRTHMVVSIRTDLGRSSR